jgi:PadR family transcriptional regulator, regulatory protein PadR
MLNKDLVAASSTQLILSILAKEESYGYDIIQRIRTLSNGHMAWSDGMLYPLLHRLEKDGSISSEWRTTETGRRRKYYRINEKGRVALEEAKTQWRIVHDTLERSWEVSYA